MSENICFIEWGEDDDHHVPDDEDDAVLPVHLPTIHMTCSNKENNRGEQSKGWVENTFMHDQDLWARFLDSSL